MSEEEKRIIQEIIESKEQVFLKMVYRTMNNGSNAITEIRRCINELMGDLKVENYSSQGKEMYRINGIDSKIRKPFIRGRRPKKFTEKQAEEMKKLKMQGKTNVEIAKIYKCTETTIRNYIKNKNRNK